ncbi:MAG: PAS domain-containing protein, partial [Fibrella sp.]|nr:PAS domain-containing protein [Armatimonadota bacterium]
MGFDLVRNGAACPEPWLLLDHCEEVVAVTDHAFRLIYINDRESDLAPSGIAQLAGQVVWDVFPESVGNLFETGLRQAVATRQPWVMIADFPSAGRFLIRGFPHSNNLFALFLRRRIGRRTAARVRG